MLFGCRSLSGAECFAFLRAVISIMLNSAQRARDSNPNFRLCFTVVWRMGIGVRTNCGRYLPRNEFANMRGWAYAGNAAPCPMHQKSPRSVCSEGRGGELGSQNQAAFALFFALSTLRKRTTTPRTRPTIEVMVSGVIRHMAAMKVSARSITFAVVL